jgi:activating signal cointegrator 1
MKAISLLQPWATLVVIGAKRIETRSWNTKYRGELLIHASARMDKAQKALTHSEPFWQYLKKLDELPLGAIIGKVNLSETSTTDFFKTAAQAKLKGIKWEHELQFGDYSPGRYGWLLKDALQFDGPIQQPGNRSLWNFPMCKVCGCWEEDACIHPKHGNCYWAEEDLCSHCKDHPGEATRYSQIIKSKPIAMEAAVDRPE